MQRAHYRILSWTVLLFILAQTGCFYYGGVSTVRTWSGSKGFGYLTATERRGRWDASGPPPEIGEATSLPIYRQLQKRATYSTDTVAKGYDLSNPHPFHQYRIVAIREIDTAKENGSTTHYYEVEFEEGNLGFN
jgi:hypothetical protein